TVSGVVGVAATAGDISETCPQCAELFGRCRHVHRSVLFVVENTWLMGNRHMRHIRQWPFAESRQNQGDFLREHFSRASGAIGGVQAGQECVICVHGVRASSMDCWGICMLLWVQWVAHD